MAKIEFETTMSSFHPNFLDMKGKDPVEKSRVKWTGIDATTGVKIQINVEGPAKDVDTLLNTFPLGMLQKND